jgi:hypothetical protein
MGTVAKSAALFNSRFDAPLLSTNVSVKLASFSTGVSAADGALCRDFD